MSPKTAQGQVRSLVKALAILDCLSADRPELGVSEIARQLGMPTSTVGRLLVTLHSAGVLSQDPATQRYRLGSKVLSWAAVYMNGLDVREKARPMLEELHGLTQETVNFYVLDGLERICIDRIESPQRLRVIVQIGERMPLYAGSAGKAILAYAPPAVLEQILERPLERMTDNTITDPAKLHEELRSIRNHGYATSYSERFTDVLGLAAPVFDAGGDVLASLNVAGPLVRFADAQVAKYAPEVMRLAHEVSQSLGYVGPYPVSKRRQR
jgi:IclR family transcriptional regulator, KDG regulon repressor